MEESQLKIETVRGPHDGEVSFSSERGGIIISLKLEGKEVLYLDKETLLNKNDNVRGGIPILFPNAGELDPNKIFPNLKRHGFARDLTWNKMEVEEGFKECLLSTSETKEVFPFDFQITILGKFEEDGSFTLSQEIKNMEKENDMPIAMGIHPYFKVLNTEKGYIKFDYERGREIEDQIETWSNGGTVYSDNPKLSDETAKMNINIPSLGTLIINPSIQYEKIWVWSIPGKDFICIEPMLREVNGLIDNPLIIGPGQTFKSNVNFMLIK